MTGVHLYQLSYSVENAFSNGSQAQEFYWNSTGNDWDVPIKKFSAHIHLPAIATVKSASAFIGPVGGMGEMGLMVRESGVLLRFERSAPLGKGSGVTLNLGLTPGSTEEPSWVGKIRWFLTDNQVLYIPIVVLFINLFLLFLWSKKGNQSSGMMELGPDTYETLSPGQMGILARDDCDSKVISAEIVSLAQKGYIEIDETKAPEGETIVSLKKTASGGLVLKPFEDALLEALFQGGDSVTTEELGTRFYVSIPKIRSLIVRDLLDRGYYLFEPFKAAKLYSMIVSGLLAVGVIYGIISFHDTFFFAASLAFLISGAIAWFFSSFIPEKTKTGAAVVEQIKRYQIYLAGSGSTESSLVSSAAVFERHLPFAIALSLDGNWAEKFQSIVQPPKWYVGTLHGGYPYGSHFTDTTVPAISSSIPNVPSLSIGYGSGGGGSGGSSGGGFGGGGGGGW